MTNPPQTDTPRTELETYTPSNGAMIICCQESGDFVKTDKYRTLERELNQANVRVVIAEQSNDELLKAVSTLTTRAEQAEAKLAAVERERDELKKDTYTELGYGELLRKARLTDQLLTDTTMAVRNIKDIKNLCDYRFRQDGLELARLCIEDCAEFLSTPSAKRILESEQNKEKGTK